MTIPKSRNLKGTLRKIYINIKFLLDQSGVGWDARSAMVTTDEDTWDELIQASPFKTKIGNPSSKSHSMVQPCTLPIYWYLCARRKCGISRLNPLNPLPKTNGVEVLPRVPSSSSQTNPRVKIQDIEEWG
ncbi:uncharacterized protein VP01_4226g1 [Puccinia sorghi]|uniref:Myb/SANT-like domain-containing protein n=1 Tax=Puccinia sorghi TaxID=27349 RepID=A0A0L6UQK2_9BASI|nr:uncharacterized protein VP01_4226g1 [Puccinia sorghi]